MIFYDFDNFLIIFDKNLKKSEKTRRVQIFKMKTFYKNAKSCPEITGGGHRHRSPGPPKNTLRDTPPILAAFKAIWSRSNDKFRPIRLLLSELRDPPKWLKMVKNEQIIKGQLFDVFSKVFILKILKGRYF